jgi:hypothetical protein
MLAKASLSTYPRRVDAKLVDRLARLELRDSSGIAQKARAILQIHTNPAVGWYFARSFARAHMKFPETMIGRDQWVFRAYMICKDPVAYHDHDVHEAYQLSQQPITSAKLKAMLITGLGKPVDNHLDSVAEKAGISRHTVEAFEVLFFNVLNRHEDGLYLSEIVYPEGRQVEFAEDYFESAPISDLLLRAGYNHRDVELVVYLSGLDDASFVTALGKLKDREAKLERQIMGNALVIAQPGLLNQRSVGLERAAKLLTTSRSARKQPEMVTCPPDYNLPAVLAAAISALPPITDTDRLEARAAARPGRSYWSDDAGNIYAFDYADDWNDAPAPSQSAAPSEPIVRFPEPIAAMWRNADFDKPVTLVARMSEPGLPDHYLTDGNIGIPVSEVIFGN